MKRFLSSATKKTKKTPPKEKTRSRLLTNGHLIDTATILAPQWRHLSPCFGAAVCNSPFKSNIWKLGQVPSEFHDDEPSSSIRRAGDLAKSLYFQPHPGASITPTRNKSMAAAYVTPEILGTLLGIALKSSPMSTKQRRKLLRDRHGIKSNHINESEWTGVSLSRWEDIVKSLQNNASGHGLELSQAIWSMMLWEISLEKACFLDAILSLEEVCEMEILDSSNNQNELARAIKHDATAQKDWASSSFDADALSNDSIQSSWDYVLTNKSQSSLNSFDMARSYEILCAALSQTPKMKPTTPHGHYRYDGGDAKPDCVEVAVRELMDLLLWDEKNGDFDLTRLPATASPKLFELYTTTSYPSTTTLQDDIDMAIADTSTPSDGGKEWFEALQNLPNCDYLSTSPNGIPYELTPTMRNISKIVQYLLLNDEKQEQDWKSLEDLQNFWKPHQLQIAFDTLAHKAGMSDDIVVYEIATISLERGARSGIDMRLRCDWLRNTGFATVTHLRFQKQRFSADIIDHLISLVTTKESSAKGIDFQCLNLLAMAAVGDHFLMMQEEQKKSANQVNTMADAYNTTSLDSLTLQVLCAPLGLDRRGLMQLAATSDLEREEKALQKALRESEDVLKAAIIEICHFVNNHATDQQHAGVQQLLIWILSELPDVDLNPATYSRQVISKDVEQAILSLPLHILVNSDVQVSICGNPFVRGDFIVAMVNWKAGNSSLLEILKALGPISVVPLLWKASQWDTT